MNARDEAAIEAAEHERDHGHLDDERRATNHYERYIFGETS